MSFRAFKNAAQRTMNYIVGSGGEQHQRHPEVFDENYQLYEECLALEKELHRRENELYGLKSKHNNYTHEKRHLENKLEDFRAQLSTVQQDLSANISFAPHEGTLEDEDLIKDFGNLCKEIEATAFGILQRLPRDLLDKPFTGYHGQKESGPFETNEIKFMKMAGSISESKPLTCFDVLFPVLRHVLSADLKLHVLGGFTSFHDDNESEFLESLGKEVQKGETQEQGARWRAMTYTHMKRADTQSLKLSADESLQQISRWMGDFFGTPHDLIPPEDYLPYMENLFDNAMVFWRAAQTKCTKYHIQVIGLSSPNNRYDEFAHGDKRKEPTQLILTVRLGLLGRLKVEDSDNGRFLKPICLLNRIVIGDNWIGTRYTRK